MNRYMNAFVFAAMLVVAQNNAAEVKVATPSRLARVAATLKSAGSTVWNTTVVTPASAIATFAKATKSAAVKGANAVFVTAPVSFWNKTFKAHPYISAATTLTVAAAAATAVYYKDAIKAAVLGNDENEDLE